MIGAGLHRVRRSVKRENASLIFRARCSPAVVVIVPPWLFNGLVFALVHFLLNGYELGGAP